MGPGGLTLDAYKGRSFKVQHNEKVRLHEPQRAHSSEADPAAKGGGAFKYSKPDYNNRLVYADASGERGSEAVKSSQPAHDVDYKRMPPRELQLFSGTLERKIVRAKVSWEPRHAVLTGNQLSSPVTAS